MKRAILVPAELAGEALDELKEWLAITTPRDDAALINLLRVALEACEGFTGRMPLVATCEEILPAGTQWQPLATRPVQAILGIEGIAADGTRFVLDPAAYLLDLCEDGAGLVRLQQRPSAARMAIRFSAGMAGDWAQLPDGLRHGVLRLAAHHYRERESDAAKPLPPAAVAALWRPWRRMRLA